MRGFIGVFFLFNVSCELSHVKRQMGKVNLTFDMGQLTLTFKNLATRRHQVSG